MPKLVSVLYECSCTGFGNPDFQCPRHKKKIVKQSQKITNVYVTVCAKCDKDLKFDDHFMWKKRKDNVLVAAHDRCLVLSRKSWVSQYDATYLHRKFKESENTKNAYSGSEWQSSCW